ncbi:hypothetical protein PUN28_000085 [Cardiocondyla obscurior]|uniref:Uncharacterized protein n=1 Tax=Cardiocondyla obscurior TaxID=286306 RepID=A0AAW2GXY5_9HYME
MRKCLIYLKMVLLTHFHFTAFIINIQVIKFVNSTTCIFFNIAAIFCSSSIIGSETLVIWMTSNLISPFVNHVKTFCMPNVKLVKLFLFHGIKFYITSFSSSKHILI